MTRHHRIGALTALALLCASTDALAQFPFPRRPRPPRIVPADHRPALGVIFGPSARAAEAESDGLEIALIGEIPLHDGVRGRVEVGGSTWEADPDRENGASRFSLTRGTAGLYRVSGVSPVHSFVGGGIGLFRHRVDGRRAAGTNGGIYGGFGMEYVGRRRAFSTEIRVGLTRRPADRWSNNDPIMLHGSVLVGLKRMF